jgi:hypothetical protein
MNEVEKRELFEQQRGIFEAGAQRADRRTGSFTFLTWPFFIAPLLANEEFLAGTFKSAAAEEEDARAARANAPPPAEDDPSRSDPSKTSAENETRSGPSASSDVHAAQRDLTGLVAQPHEDTREPNPIRTEAVAVADAQRFRAVWRAWRLAQFVDNWLRTRICKRRRSYP